MTHWNKVSPPSPYLDDIQSSIGEEPVRAWFVRLVGSLRSFSSDLGTWCLYLEKQLADFRCDDFNIFVLSVISIARFDIFNTPF